VATKIEDRPLRVPSRPVRPPVRRRHPAAGRSVGLILPAVLLFYAVIIPSELRISIADQTLFPPRIVGFLVLPFVVKRLIQDPIRWSILDGLFAFACFWMVFAFMNYYGVGEGFVRGSVLALDAIIPYLVARACIRDHWDWLKFLVCIAPGLGIAAATLLVEVLYGDWIIRPVFASLFGNLQTFQNGVAVGAREFEVETRMGIIRATGPFSHPILAGLILSSLLAAYVYSGLRGWPRIVGVLAAASAILSGSSTAFLGLIISVGILVVDRIQKLIAFVNWRGIILVSTVGLIAIHLATENGIIRFLAGYTLNPQTAFYRTMIWDFGTDSVMRHPWFGIGFTAYERDHWMPSSVDSHWLMLAIRFGLVPSLFIFTTTVSSILLVAKAAQGRSPIERNIHVGLATSLFAVTIGGFAVAFFGGAEVWVYMLIGIGISIASAPRSHQTANIRRGHGRKELLRPQMINPRRQVKSEV